MPEQQERLWDYETVEPGQQGQPTLVTLTAENIGEYALAAQNPDSRYQKGDAGAGANLEFDGRLAAMPTMAVTYAPLLRDYIAENCGFVALERSKQARRQTPFAKCEVRWFAPALEGDTITGKRGVLERYERRGSRFVTFRVEASNQRGERVAEYDYTCIFDYAKGQREVPAAPGAAPPSRPELDATPLLDDASSPANPLLPQVSYDRVAIGDQLAALQITESDEVILRKNRLRLAGEPNPSNIHTDEEFARQNIFGGAVNSGPATMSYVDQMLQRSFPLHAFYDGGSLLMRAITPFRAGDTVTFAGEVTAIREGAGQKLVECRIRGINQRGELVSLSDATLVLSRDEQISD